MKRGFYRFCSVLMRIIFGVLFPARVEGLENIPSEGAFVLCCNHLSARDPIFVGIHIRSRAIHFMAKSELFRLRPVATVLKWLGAFPVDRGHSDLNAMRTALKVLADGHGLGVFPQGTRSPDNSPTPMLNGVSLIAMRAGAPVIPAYIDGPYRLFRRTLLRFGPAVDISEFGRKFDSATLTAVTHVIESAVWGMRPSGEAER